jgi:hypothetical protein
MEVYFLFVLAFFFDEAFLFHLGEAVSYGLLGRKDVHHMGLITERSEFHFSHNSQQCQTVQV